jgi:glycosyltransferase involved in cell wall biosynthesis
MDLCGDMLLAHLPREGPHSVDPARLCPPFHTLASWPALLGCRRAAINAERLFNRFVNFPREARRHARRFDLFHVADHTYAQLVHDLPPGRTGVYCHDLDAFACLLDPTHNPRPRWFRALALRILSGMQKAAVVFHNSMAVGQKIARAGLVPSDRLVHAPLGVAPEFAAESPQSPVVGDWLERLDDEPWLLHVGSCLARKRIDVLLDVFATVRKELPRLRLVKIGGEWAAEHRGRIARLGLAAAIVHVHGLTRDQLAAVYRRAGVLLVPSEAEGFGLPVIEALACGTAVVASDIAPLREAGGRATVYAPVGDIGAWADAVLRVLIDPHAAPPRPARLAAAARYSWTAHAETVAAAYRRLLEPHTCAASLV